MMNINKKNMATDEYELMNWQRDGLMRRMNGKEVDCDAFAMKERTVSRWFFHISGSTFPRNSGQEMLSMIWRIS